MIKLYICCLVLIIGSVEVGPDIGMKFHQEVMEMGSSLNHEMHPDILISSQHLERNKLTLEKMEVLRVQTIRTYIHWT